MQEMQKLGDYQDNDEENVNLPKHQALYNDAKHRLLRHEHIYSKCIDRECTFKPKLITKESILSQNLIQEVKNEVQ